MVAEVVGDDVEKAMDQANVELKHEHGFYEDGKNYGFFEDGIRSDNTKFENYTMEDIEYDDKTMEKVEKQLRQTTNPDDYSLLGSNNKKKNNCQDLADQSRHLYGVMARGKNAR